jgi:hypothetical protein
VERGEEFPGFSPFLLCYYPPEKFEKGKSVLVELQRWASIVAESLLLVRAVQGKFIGKYLIFYIYLSSVLLLELLRFEVQYFQPDWFPIVYWRTEYVPVLLSYVVIFEIYKHGFEKFPGTVKVSYVLLAVISLVLLLRLAFQITNGSGWWTGASIRMVEREMRIVQAFLLLMIIWLLSRYAIPVGRNFIGIVLGYGLYTATSLTTLAIGSQPQYNFSTWWRAITPFVYALVLLVWCITLWSYRPNPEPEPESMFERDYRLIAQRTKGILSKAFSYLKLGEPNNE